ncbi:serine hydrolase [uncultured Psychrobacillus sp.]|uniref:serine hydrolase n=1 Tax=uncultured Psychrobacillus sp. TaxID=1551585 RepID=UPI0026165A71|nr:serine hydrolase [uncultured Psychrobacillus sp.]
MSIYMWIGIGIYAFFTLLPLKDVKNIGKWEISSIIINMVVLLTVILAHLFFGFNIWIGILLLIILGIFLDKKTYTKKRLIIYASLFVVIGGVLYWLLNDILGSPESNTVLEHLIEYPDTSSLYFSKDGNVLVSYNVEENRPLASVVKIVVAMEYAFQVEEGKINPTTRIGLEDLDVYYIPNTDGEAHEAWLDSLETEKPTLQEVAKGMIKFSSNANTEYLMELLGLDAINNRLEVLDIENHEEIYPIVGALAISSYLKEKENLSKKALINRLNNMSMEEYRSLAKEVSQLLKSKQFAVTDVSDISMDIQRIWSDRLTGASAEAYGEIVSRISNNEFSSNVTSTLRDILEWPLAYESNQEKFDHIGAKGGSTAFVLNQVIYVETKQGERMEMVIMLDDLSLLQSLSLQKSIDHFLFKLIDDQDYIELVESELP